ncbi:MAG TPA: hydrogenase formation protein HypD [Cyclobacteriaceae bacterium]|nr:hydrogenase formation protein HypD [Cyclobacteriaceae bacterium]
MKYVDEFRDKSAVRDLISRIGASSTKRVSFMEVCGGHTMAIQKSGIPSLLPENITLKSGPGCPVCVSSRGFIDQAVALSRIPGVIIATFGDLIRVPGSYTTLEKAKAEGSRVEIVYSILDALKIAEKYPDRKIIFLGIGFETTAPSTAAGILMARSGGLKNFFVLSSHKVMPPAMRALVEEGINIDGFIGPGHVSTITGSAIYEELPRLYRLGCVISGFEPVDILQSIYMLVMQAEKNEPKVEIQYKRAVKPEGNRKALDMLDQVFELCDDWWRGLGILKSSGLRLKNEFADFDAGLHFHVEVPDIREDARCLCGDVLKGRITPDECSLFGKSCNPVNPVGACMVSNEGACHAYYRYHYHGR